MRKHAAKILHDTLLWLRCDQVYTADTMVWWL